MAAERTPPDPQGPDRGSSSKSADAYRTISEVSDDLRLPQHVLRFWETRFPQIKPMKRAGGRRFYRPEDVALLRAVQALLYEEGYTIKGVQRLLAEFGARHVADALARSRAGPAAPPPGFDAPHPVGSSGGAGEGDGEPARPVPALEDPVERATDKHQPTRAEGLVQGLTAIHDDLLECARLIASVRKSGA